jgi:hypothetical protein
MKNRSSPPASPDPSTGAHHAARAVALVMASKSAPGEAFTWIVVS